MSDKEIIYINCPICRKKVEWSEASPYRPFCSKRCQLIDLGSWASEENYIPSDESNCDHSSDSDVLSPFDKEDN